MIDLVKLILVAGDGGDGKVSFRREWRVPRGGPDGGIGGNGGNVIIRGNKNLASLKHFSGRVLFEAEDGQNGGKRKKIGAKGESLVLEVPLGTSVSLLAENKVAWKRRNIIGAYGLLKRDDANRPKYYVTKDTDKIPVRDPETLRVVGENEDLDRDDLNQEIKSSTQEILSAVKDVEPIKIAEITKDGEEVVVAQGGFGGRGNDYFKSSVNTTPLVAEYGSFGEKRAVVLELKLLADVGLVGLPSVGKSTLLSVLTSARPKIAAYPFTTLEPNLGILEKFDETNQLQSEKEIVIADVPGLIEGASEGRGLGLNFLRHIENCKALLFVLALTEEDIFNEDLDNTQKAKKLWDQFELLRAELKKHKKILVDKKHIISINKLDLYPEELLGEIKSVFAEEKIEPILFSAATKQGIGDLIKRLNDVV
jgi:GTPase